MQVYKAIKYIRLSYTDDKTVESDSVANQRRLIDDYIARHPEIEVVAEKIDDGYSGVLFDRPAFQEMMRMIEQGEANCVIVKDLSRLGREYIETGRYMRRVFPAYGVRFIAKRIMNMLSMLCLVRLKYLKNLWTLWTTSLPDTVQWKRMQKHWHRITY